MSVAITRIEKKCQFCSADFRVHKYRENTAKYCSKSCVAKGKIAEFGHSRKGKPGKPLSYEHRQKLREKWLGNKLRQGLEPPNKGKTHLAGEKHWNWQGGISSEQTKERTSTTYRNWTMTVYKRDYYTCQMPSCGYKGQTIEAHHIIPFKDSKELRHELTNGITLCRECHKLTRNKEYFYKNLFSNLVGKYYQAMTTAQLP